MRKLGTVEYVCLSADEGGMAGEDDGVREAGEDGKVERFRGRQQSREGYATLTQVPTGR